MSLQDPFLLNGRHILITGASSGIGKACSVLFASRGASLCLLARDQGRLQETLSLTSDPQNHSSVSVDLTDYKLVEDAVRSIVKEKGPISGIVNCAGISTTLPLNATTIEKMEHFIRTNVIGPISLTKQVLKPGNFAPEGGSIVFLSSVMGVTGEKGKTLYSLTKGALISSVRSLAIELASKKIRVNAVSPGVVNSPMSRNAVYSRDDEALDKIRLLHPLGLGEPDDVANACMFLISDASKWITGTNVIVDGGYLAK
jgi:NAD(P)-dependent dehydrogenase (short-subunit alcohol dehydrogenase family)